MSDNSALASALANPAQPDAPAVEMALIQTVGRPELTRTDADGNVVVVRAAVVAGTVHRTVMLPATTTFQPPSDMAVIPAGGLKAGDVAKPKQLVAAQRTKG